MDLQNRAVNNRWTFSIKMTTAARLLIRYKDKPNIFATMQDQWIVQAISKDKV